MPRFSNQMPTMNDVFKSHPHPETAKGLLESYRLKARTVIQESIPAGIIRLQALIAEESDPNSPLWIGQIEQGGYRSENLRLLQPEEVGTAEFQGMKITSAKDICGTGTLVGQVDVGVSTDEEGVPHVSNRHEELEAGTGTSGQEQGGMVVQQKIGARWFEVFAKNETQEKLIDIIRKEAEALMFNLNDLRVWLSLETPIIEDGNSFGADVQKHIYDHIEKSFGRASQYMNGAKRHHDDRCLAVAKWIQMPNVADYAASIAASDRIDNVLARNYLRNMLVIYAGVLSQLERNWEKVINPKGHGGGGDAMY